MVRGFEDVPIDWAPLDSWDAEDGRPCQRLSFIVPGSAKPKGSVVKGRWGGYHDTAKGIGDWLDSVSTQARAAMNSRWRRNQKMQPAIAPMFDEAVMLRADFVMPAPKTFTPPVWLKGQNLFWRTLFRDGTPPHVKKPDVSKLLRGIEDAMTGIVWQDDSQVVGADVTKRYAHEGETPGVLIMVSTADLGES